MSFAKLKLDDQVLKRVAAQKFEQPTPIQKKAIPILLKGQDTIGLAQTGTGKTAAFVLPILHELVTEKRVRGVQALIITPTRELAEQIHETVLALSKGLGIKSVSVYGGVSIHNQIKKLKTKADIVVACPGRLLDHISRGTIRLDNLQTLVLDEADQMLDMGFFPDIKRIVSTLPDERQTVLFSATMPKEIEKLASEILYKPKRIQVDKREVTKQVAHSVFHVAAADKQALLTDVIGTEQSFSTLVFTRTKYRARTLTKKLNKSGIKAAELHGNLSVNQRKRSVDGFKSGRYAVLVATDVAARGIDISGISHVINYDVPVTPEIYIHRLGRTGRAAESGVAYTFAAPDEMQLVRRIEKVLKHSLPVQNQNGKTNESFAGTKTPAESKPKAKRKSAGDRQPAKAKDKPKSKPKSKRNAGNERAQENTKAKSKAYKKPNAKTAGKYKPKAKRNGKGPAKPKTKTKSKHKSGRKPKVRSKRPTAGRR